MYENIKTVESGGAVTFISGFLKGALVAVVVTVAVFAVFAFLLSWTPMPDDAIRYIAYITEAAAAFIAGFVPAKKAGKKGILTGGVSGAVYMLIIWLAASLASDGFFFDTHVLIMLLVSAAAGALGGITGVNLKSSNTNKKKR